MSGGVRLVVRGGGCGRGLFGVGTGMCEKMFELCADVCGVGFCRGETVF